MAGIKVHTPEIFKVQESIAPKGRILVYNEDRSIVHEFDATNVPELVDYVRDDPNLYGKTYVWGFIEDNLLVVERRVAPQIW